MRASDDVAEPDLRVRFGSVSAQASRADAGLSALESLCGGEVVVVVDEEEIFEELLVAHGEAELALQLLAGAPPSPLPVREAAV